MWDFRAQLVKAHDGDTFRVLADTMFGQRYEVDLRLLRVSAPELHQPGGTEAAAFVARWLALAAETGLRWPLYVRTVKTRTVEPESRRTLNRYLAEVWRWGQRPDAHNVGGTSLNDSVRSLLAANPGWPSGR